MMASTERHCRIYDEGDTAALQLFPGRNDGETSSTSIDTNPIFQDSFQSWSAMIEKSKVKAHLWPDFSMSDCIIESSHLIDFISAVSGKKAIMESSSSITPRHVATIANLWIRVSWKDAGIRIKTS